MSGPKNIKAKSTQEKFDDIYNRVVGDLKPMVPYECKISFAVFSFMKDEKGNCQSAGSIYKNDVIFFVEQPIKPDATSSNKIMHLKVLGADRDIAGFIALCVTKKSLRTMGKMGNKRLFVEVTDDVDCTSC